MKALGLCLAVSALSHLATAIPGGNYTTPPTWTNSSEPDIDPMGLGGTLITDPDRIAYLETLHQDALEKMKHSEALPVASAEEAAAALASLGPHDKRFLPIIGIGGLFLVRSLGTIGKAIDNIRDALMSMFTGEDVVWIESGRCRHEIDTWAGWRGTFRTWGRDKGGGENMWEEKNIAWINPTDPLSRPEKYFFENQYLGLYSVQFTGTDKSAWHEIEGTVKCPMEGICNPQYIFHRRGYHIVLNTWQSQGVISDCHYKKNCGGLCQDKIKSQSSSGGMIWSSKCAVPCSGDGADGFDTVPAENPRIMIAGDSISHGGEDDFTWRWRLN